MDNAQLVENIKNLCNKNNITTSQLEKALNLSNGLISRWKDKTPTLERLLDIAQFFDVTIDSLIGTSTESEVDNKVTYLIRVLYQQTRNLKIKWNVLDINNPPINFTKIIYETINNTQYDYYYTVFENGCFLIGTSYQDSNNKLVLYVIPDSNSLPQIICSDYNQISKLFELVSNDLKKELNEMKTNKFINSFLNSINTNKLNEDSYCDSENKTGNNTIYYNLAKFG